MVCLYSILTAAEDHDEKRGKLVRLYEEEWFSVRVYSHKARAHMISLVIKHGIQHSHGRVGRKLQDTERKIKASVQITLQLKHLDL